MEETNNLITMDEQMNLDPARVQEAATIVAQAKQAMQYLKDALSALKSPGKGKAPAPAAAPQQAPSAQATMSPEEVFGGIPAQDAQAMEGLNNPQPQY